MNLSAFFSKFGAVLAVVYVVVAIAMVREDRRSTAGGWISLHGMTSFLATLPASALSEMLGRKLDHRRNFDMVIAIAVCALLVYCVGLGLDWLAHVVFRGGTK